MQPSKLLPQIDWIGRFLSYVRTIGKKIIKLIWQWLKFLADEHAYEAYLDHFNKHHSHEKPLCKTHFYRELQKEKWKNIKKCC